VRNSDNIQDYSFMQVQTGSNIH